MRNIILLGSTTKKTPLMQDGCIMHSLSGKAHPIALGMLRGADLWVPNLHKAMNPEPSPNCEALKPLNPETGPGYAPQTFNVSLAGFYGETLHASALSPKP